MSGSVSALQPNLSLNATGGLPQGSSAPLNPFDMISRLSEIQNRQNQNTQFQQVMAARQRAGEIIAAAPDLETGLAAATKDPQVAAFAGDVLQTARATQQAESAYLGQTNKNRQDALGAVIRAASSASNPSQFDQAMKTQLAAVPDTLRNDIMPAVTAFRSAMLDGLPAGAAGQAEYQSRRTGSMVGAQFSSDAIHAANGTSSLLDTPNGFQPISTPSTGGPVVTNGPLLKKGIAPQLVTGPDETGAQVTKPYGGLMPDGGALVPQAAGDANPLGVPLTQMGGAQQGVPNAPGPVAGATPPANALRVPTPPAPILRGPTPGAVTAQQKASDLDNEVEKSVVEGGQGLQKNVKDINLAIDALGKAQAGGGANMRGALGQLVEAAKNLGVPVSQDAVDELANGSLAGTELFKKVMGGIAIRELGVNAKNQGHTFSPEVNQALANYSADVTPDALVKLLSSVKQGYQADFDRSLKLPMYREMLKARDAGVEVPGLPEGYQMRDFNTWYNNQYNVKNLPTNNAAGGMDVGPVDPVGIKGTTENKAAAAAKPVRRFNRQTGQFEDIK